MSQITDILEGNSQVWTMSYKGNSHDSMAYWLKATKVCLCEPGICSLIQAAARKAQLELNTIRLDSKTSFIYDVLQRNIVLQ